MITSRRTVPCSPAACLGISALLFTLGTTTACHRADLRPGDDIQNLPCDTGALRCNGDVIETCVDARWEQVEDCAPTGMICNGAGIPVCSCAAGRLEDHGVCRLPGNGYTCEGPRLIDFGVGHVNGTTTAAGDDTQGSCGSAGNEVVYGFAIHGRRHLTVSNNGPDTLVYIRSTCDDASAEIACKNAVTTASSLPALSIDLEAGTYFLYVESTGTSGAYDLQVNLGCGDGSAYNATTGDCVDDPCDPNPCLEANKTLCTATTPPAYVCSCDLGYVAQGTGCSLDPSLMGEGCNDAIPLLGNNGSVSDNNANSDDSGTGTCNVPAGGPDRVYTFLTNATTRIKLTLKGVDPVLHVRRDCALAGTQVACNDNASPSDSNASINAELAPGRYFIFADSYQGGSDYELTYAFFPNPCASDPCPGLAECVPSPDWSQFRCVCPAGTVPFDNSCVDDPCSPNPCQDQHKTVCVPELPTAHTCACDPGYLPSGSSCVTDPGAYDWTFMVYMNADNDLEPYGYDDIAEMQKAGSTSRVHIVVLMDTMERDNGVARRLYITKGGQRVLADLGEVDMGDWRTLADFGKWAVESYPAQHYALVMWDHGDGWRSTESTTGLLKGFSNDYTSGNAISVAGGGFGSALSVISQAAGGKLDIVGFDACLMGTWEVAEASAPFAKLLVASEETEPAAGWSYDEFLSPLVAIPQTEPINFAKSIVNTYYGESASNSTLALIDLGTADALATRVSALADALRASPDSYSKIETARAASQYFTDDDDRDLKDFARKVAALTGIPATITTAAQALVTQLDASILHNRAQADYSGATGLSIYAPSLGWYMDSRYTAAGAVWSERTTWDEFLKTYANRQ